MRLILVPYIALLAVGGVACSSGEAYSPPEPRGSLTRPAVTALARQRARELVVAADHELDDLVAIEHDADDDAVRHAAILQADAIVRWRDATLGELARPGNGGDLRALSVDVRNLGHALRVTAAAEPQAPEPPPFLDAPDVPRKDARPPTP